MSKIKLMATVCSILIALTGGSLADPPVTTEPTFYTDTTEIVIKKQSSAFDNLYITESWFIDSSSIGFLQSASALDCNHSLFYLATVGCTRIWFNYLGTFNTNSRKITSSYLDAGDVIYVTNRDSLLYIVSVESQIFNTIVYNYKNGHVTDRKAWGISFDDFYFPKIDEFYSGNSVCKLEFEEYYLLLNDSDANKYVHHDNHRASFITPSGEAMVALKDTVLSFTDKNSTRNMPIDKMTRILYATIFEENYILILKTLSINGVFSQILVFLKNGDLNQHITIEGHVFDFMLLGSTIHCIVSSKNNLLIYHIPNMIPIQTQN